MPASVSGTRNRITKATVLPTGGKSLITLEDIAAGAPITFDSIQDLRSNTHEYLRVYVNSYYGTTANITSIGSGGEYVFDPLDTTSNDNGGTIIVDASGHRFHLYNTGTVTPQIFGAIGDGTSHPASQYYNTLADLQTVFPFTSSLEQEIDWISWQAALYSNTNIISTPKTYIMCNSNTESMNQLTLIAGISHFDAGSSTFDFSAMVAQTSNTNFVPDNNFATAGTWYNSKWPKPNSIDVDFSGGAAVGTDNITSATVEDTFYLFGQKLTLEPGLYTASITWTATLGESYYYGHTNPPYGSIGFANGPEPGNYVSGYYPGGSGILSSTVFEGIFSGEVGATTSFTFQVTQSFTGWFQFNGGGYMNIRISDMSIKPYFYNCGMNITRDNSPQHYPLENFFKNFYLLTGNPGVCGIRYKSFVDLDGTCGGLQNVVVSGDPALSLEDGAYLIDFYNVFCGGNVGVRFPAGSQNAGENFRWFGGSIGGGNYGLDNIGGAEFAFFATTLDYTPQLVINHTGRIEMHDVHTEFEIDNAVSYPDAPNAGTPIFQLETGHIIMFGGMMLGAGNVGKAGVPPIELATSLSAMIHYGTQIYNISSLSGVAFSGQGLYKAYGWNDSGNPNFGLKLMSMSPAMDIWGGAGDFEPLVYGTNEVFNPWSPAGTPAYYVAPALDVALVNNTGIYIDGGVYTAAGSGVIPTDRYNIPAVMLCSVTNSVSHTGEQSLEVAQLQPYGNGASLIMFCPCKPAQTPFISYNLLTPFSYAQATCTIEDTTLTVLNFAGKGVITPGQALGNITGTTLSANTVVVEQLSGAPNGIGTYSLNKSGTQTGAVDIFFIGPAVTNVVGYSATLDATNCNLGSLIKGNINLIGGTTLANNLVVTVTDSLSATIINSPVTVNTTSNSIQTSFEIVPTVNGWHKISFTHTGGNAGIPDPPDQYVYTFYNSDNAVFIPNSNYIPYAQQNASSSGTPQTMIGSEWVDEYGDMWSVNSSLELVSSGSVPSSSAGYGFLSYPASVLNNNYDYMLSASFICPDITVGNSYYIFLTFRNSNPASATDTFYSAMLGVSSTPELALFATVDGVESTPYVGTGGQLTAGAKYQVVGYCYQKDNATTSLWVGFYDDATGSLQYSIETTDTTLRLQNIHGQPAIAMHGSGPISFTRIDTYLTNGIESAIPQNPLYQRWFWVQQQGTDQYNRPLLSGIQQFAGENDIQVSCYGNDNWQPRSFVPDYAAAASTVPALINNPLAPEWATHLAMTWETESIPPMFFYIDTLQGNVIG